MPLPSENSPQLLLDTTILLEIFQKNHRFAPSLFEECQLVINDHILADFLTLIQKNYPAKIFTRVRQLLISQEYIKIDCLRPGHLDHALKIINNSRHQNLTLKQCLTLAHAKLNNLTLATSDPDLKRYKMVKHW